MPGVLGEWRAAAEGNGGDDGVDAAVRHGRHVLRRPAHEAELLLRALRAHLGVRALREQVGAPSEGAVRASGEASQAQAERRERLKGRRAAQAARHVLVGVDTNDLLDGARVVRHVRAGAHANLEHGLAAGEVQEEVLLRERRGGKGGRFPVGLAGVDSALRSSSTGSLAAHPAEARLIESQAAYCGSLHAHTRSTRGSADAWPSARFKPGAADQRALRSASASS